jgi:hypothetical protein
VSGQLCCFYIARSSAKAHHRDRVRAREQVDLAALRQAGQLELLGVLAEHLHVLQALGGEAAARDLEQRLAQVDEVDLRELLEREVLCHLLDVPACALGSARAALHYCRTLPLTGAAANVDPHKRLAGVRALHLAQLRRAEPARGRELVSERARMRHTHLSIVRRPRSRPLRVAS